MKHQLKNNAQTYLAIRAVLGLLLFILITPFLHSQSQGGEAFKNHESQYSEQLHISTDRDFYAAGEKVWLKIYKINGLTQLPSNISKVIYVDILDLENNPLTQLKIAAEGFSASASFELPDTLRSGNYILRAYSSWMQNFSKDLFASRTINVINPFDKISDLKIPINSQDPDSVIFYTEGGLLLSGIESGLGFRTLLRNGSPVSLDGLIMTDRNDTVCEVKSGNNGYGLTRLKPVWPARLFLVFTKKNQVKRFPLPEVHNEGVLLTTPSKNKNSDAIVSLNISPGFSQADKPLYLVINSPGLASIRKEIKSGMGTEIRIASDDLPSGISHLSVVDEQERTLTDRWVSKTSRDRINFKISIEGKDHHPRQKIKIDVSVPNSIGEHSTCDLTVSVAKTISVNPKGPDKRLRQMPGMFPACEDCNIGDMNDYLVFYKPHLSQSEGNGANGSHLPLYLPEMEGHLISGTIKDRISGEPLRNESITLSFVGKAALCLFTITDDNGNFNFVTKERGLKEIVIQPLVPVRQCYIDLNNPFASGLIDYDHGSLYPDTGKLDEINNLIISAQINNIYEPFYMKVNQPADEVRYNFYGQPDNSIVMSRYIELTSVKEIITELIPGVATTRKEGKVNFRLTKPNQTQPFEKGPLVLVDGIPVYDLDKVVAISSKDIEKVDVMIDRYYIAGNVLDGILHFITVKGNLSAIDLDRSVFRMEYDLLKREETFYSPDYSVDSMRNNHLPDFRNTLYWNPDVRTDKTGKASVEFYSSDESCEYTVTVTGMMEDGRKGSASASLMISP